MTNRTNKHDSQSYWLDDPKNVRNLSLGLAALCAVLMLLDLDLVVAWLAPIIDLHKHPHYPIEKRFGFYGWFGFISFTCIVLAGKYMRRFVRREEDYYDR